MKAIELPSIKDTTITCTTKARLPDYARRIAMFAGDGDITTGLMIALHEYAVSHGILTADEINRALIDALTRED